MPSGIDGIEKLAAYIGGFCILLMTLIVTYNVVMRYVFHSPVGWSLEITGYLMIACVFLPLALNQSEERQIKVDLIHSRLSPGVKSAVDLTTTIIALVFFALLTWKGWDLAYFSFKHGLASTTAMKTPLFPSQLLIPIGAFMICIRFLIQIHRQIRLLANRK